MVRWEFMVIPSLEFSRAYLEHIPSSRNKTFKDFNKLKGKYITKKQVLQELSHRQPVVGTGRLSLGKANRDDIGAIYCHILKRKRNHRLVSYNSRR